MHTFDRPHDSPRSIVGPDNPDWALSRLLEPLIGTVRAMIGSYLGMSITVVIDGHGGTVTAFEDFIQVDDIATSMVLPLAALCEAEPGSVLILYAGAAGAFVDFAADMSRALDVSPGALALDEHLSGPAPVAGVTGVADLSEVNQAIGILLNEGRTLLEASTHLEHLARRDHTTVPTAARHLIDRTCDTPPPSGHPRPRLVGSPRRTPPAAPLKPRSAA